jgi:hypothetical protein
MSKMVPILSQNAQEYSNLGPNVEAKTCIDLVLNLPTKMFNKTLGLKYICVCMA